MKDLHNSRLKRSVLQGKTVMNFALRKKDILNTRGYELISKNEKDLFLKTVLVTHNQKNTISFDISGLIPFSELLAEEISQEQYFTILSNIINTIEYCKRNGISSDSIFCDPDKIYINKTTGSVFLAVLPLNQGSIISSCARSLSDADKMAKLAVSDISKLQRYQKFLTDQIIIKKKNRELAFEEQKMKAILENNVRNKNFIDNFTNSKNINDNSDTVPETQAPTEINTAPLIKTHRSVTRNNCLPSAFVTDSKGMKYYIDHIPFNFGRNDKSDNIDVSLPDIPEVSGFHASIIFDDGKYYLKDQHSTNGTFLIHESEKDILSSSQKQIEKSELSNGDTFYLYHTPFRFSMDDASSHTCLVEQENYDDSKTMCIDSSQNPGISNYLSYITDDEEKVTAYLSAFPYCDEQFPGITIERIFENSRIKYKISNLSADDLLVAGNEVKINDSVIIFSGCSFSLGSRRFTFYIKY